jgi:hypothetical protein
LVGVGVEDEVFQTLLEQVRELHRRTVSHHNVWAVGGSRHPLIVHWDGKRWTGASPARLRHLKASLEAISAVSAREIWAAGPRLLARYSC